MLLVLSLSEGLGNARQCFESLLQLANDGITHNEHFPAEIEA
jgi:hypothetical protein